MHTGDQCSISRPSSRRRCVQCTVAVVASCARAWRLSPPEHRSHPLTITSSPDVRRCNDDIAWLQLLWSSGRALSEPASRYGSVALCERSDRRSAGSDSGSGVVQTPWSREPRPRRAGRSDASSCFVRCSAVRLVHSHHPHSTLSVTSASLPDMRTLETSRVLVGGRHATIH